MAQVQTNSRFVHEATDSDFDKLLEKEFSSNVEAVKAITEGQLDAMFRNSASHSRSVAAILKDAVSLATLNPRIAEKCIYAVPRDGKRVSGPSIRLAEIMASVWGHITLSSQKISDDGKTITVQGTAIDTLTGVSYTVPVERRVTKRDGSRYSDDMVITTTNAAVSIALRNAILRVVPGAITEEVMDACRAVLAGDLKTVAERRAKAVEFFTAKGVSDARIFATLGVKGIEDIGVDELIVLTGIRNELSDGLTSLDRAFPDTKPNAAAELNARLNATREHPNGTAGAGREVELPPAPAPASEPSLGDANATPPTTRTRRGSQQSAGDMLRGNGDEQ